MRKFCLLVALGLYSLACFATEPNKVGAITNLCNNLNHTCEANSESACAAYKSVGCECDSNTGTCTRGNSQ